MLRLQSTGNYSINRQWLELSAESQRQKTYLYITKTRLFKYTENFTTKKWKFSDKKPLIFFIFLLKT